MQKKYFRTVIEFPNGDVIKEKWRPIVEDAVGEANVLEAVAATLRGDMPFFRVTTRSDTIEIVPVSILANSQIRIEYSRFGL